MDTNPTLDARAPRANLPLLPGLSDRFAAAGVVFKVQPEKQDGPRGRLREFEVSSTGQVD